MPTYSAEISRGNPACILFLIDQSGSMADPFGAGEGGQKKADGVATAINRLLQNLCIKCAKEEGVRDYFHVGVIGYGTQVGPAFSGALAGKEMAAISEIASMPARVETRTKKVDDGVGGLIDQTVRFPVWFEPVANGGTPMCQALGQAAHVLQTWLAQHPNCFPPVVINITDGESQDGDPTNAADGIKAMSSSDGQVLLFNLHLSSQRQPAIEFPNSEVQLPDQYAQLLFRMSSPLTPFMISVARQEGYSLQEGAKGFAFNADLVATIKFLDVGTRPSNLR
ncbi:MAG: vWA domain-containing protein [Gemmataceae bacterium]